MVEPGADSPRIAVVWGTATGPTAVASYDAALADANVHEFNLATVSSIVPPGVPVEPVGTAGDLGPVGGRLWVVESRATIDGPGRATAVLGWTVGPDGGVFYESAGPVDEPRVREEVRRGLAAARDLRHRELPDEELRSASVGVPNGAYGTAVVLAVYGSAESMF